MNKEEIEELKDFTIDLTDIDELALGLEVCSKKSNMIIQEFADTIIQLQQENKQLNKIIEEIKEDIENAINEAINNKINLEINTNNRGRYDAYVYVLDRIEELERSDSNE